jgi:hypothetical protein
MTALTRYDSLPEIIILHVLLMYLLYVCFDFFVSIVCVYSEIEVVCVVTCMHIIISYFELYVKI